MKRIFKFRIFPTKGQKSKLNKTLEGCKLAYNLCLQTRIDEYIYNNKTLSLYDTFRLAKDWKKNDPLINIVHAHIIQQVCERVDLAFKAFWRRCKSGENPGYPRFKSEDRYKSFTFTNSDRGFKLIDNKTLKISGIGNVRIKKHRAIPGTIKRLTVKREASGFWFANFHIEIDEGKALPVSDRAIGIDVGIESFATLSNGEVIENPRFLKQDRKRLKKLVKQLCQSSIGSERRAKKTKAHAKVWNKIGNRRNNFAHQTSRRLVERFGIICVEDLDIKNMVSDGINDFLNEATYDVAWGNFLAMINYKAEEAGRVFVQVDPRGTSQDCSQCGQKVFKDLKVRIHDCPHCGLKIHRDLNAAINILRRGLASLADAV